MPAAVNALAQLVSSTSVIDSFVHIGQMGAMLADVSAQVATLWMLVALHGTLAFAVEWRAKDGRARTARHDPEKWVPVFGEDRAPTKR